MSTDQSTEAQDAALNFTAGLEAFAAIYQSKWPDTLTLQEDSCLRVYSQSVMRPDPGNHPQILHHGERSPEVLVLIHGITDSPHYVAAIGKQFHAWGFNVVMPLLPAHGEQRPWPAMRALQHTDWIAEVDTIVAHARALGDRVSVGGFSTGGALAVRKVTKDPAAINGGLFLFAAALEIGALKEFLMESNLGSAIGRALDGVGWLHKRLKSRMKGFIAEHGSEDLPDNHGIGSNPVKYDVFFLEGAAELADVIDDIDDHYDEQDIPRYSTINQPVFIAHSRADEAALFAGAKLLADNLPTANRHCYFVDDLEHASLVLQTEVQGDPKPVPANPEFQRMMDEIRAFVSERLL